MGVFRRGKEGAQSGGGKGPQFARPDGERRTIGARKVGRKGRWGT